MEFVGMGSPDDQQIKHALMRFYKVLPGFNSRTGAAGRQRVQFSGGSAPGLAFGTRMVDAQGSMVRFTLPHGAGRL